MKKSGVLTLLLLVMLMQTFMPISHAQEDSNSLSLFLDNFAKKLYENKDIGTNHKLDQFIEGNSTKLFVSEKIAVHQLVTKRAFLEKKNYTVKTEIIKTQELDKVTTTGPYGTSFSNWIFDERNGYPYSNGDIIQHASSSTSWTHTTIITEVYQYYPDNPYYLAPFVCGRTAGEMYNFDQPAEEFWPGCPKRVIKLTGNRE